MGIPVNCWTNLDDYKYEMWPVKFCCRPMVGDKVRSASGRILNICSIAHAGGYVGQAIDSIQSHHGMLEIELSL